MAEAAPERLDSVQALRALAALAVVKHHIPILGNGAWGVDLFFVISGFIMCHVTQHDARHFFTKRLIRIVPLYWLGTLCVFAVALLAPGLLRHTEADPVQLLKSLFFIPFAKGDGVQPMLYLGWTLNYEMLFYVLFALSLRVSHAYRAAVCSAALVALVALGQAFPHPSVPWTFFTRSIVLEFALGMACFSVWNRLRLLPPDRVREAACVVLGAAAVLLLPLLSYLEPRELPRVLRWGLLAALAFVLLVHGLRSVRIPALLILLGDASYSLYLFHPYIIRAFAKGLGAFGQADAGAYAMAAVAAILCSLAAIALYRGVEQPLIRVFRRRLLPAAESGRRP